MAQGEQQTGAAPGPQSGKSAPKILAIALALIVVVLTIIVVTNGDDSSNQKATSGTQSSAQARDKLEAVQDKYEKYDRQDFQQLATPAVDYSKNDRFIERKLEGLDPAGKVDQILRAGAQDKVALVGLIKQNWPNGFSAKQLRRAQYAPQTSRQRYRMWNVLRDGLVGSADVKNIKLNGRWQNASLSDSGGVGFRPASYRNEPATRLRLASVTINGRAVPSHTVVIKDICGNRQVKTRQVARQVVSPPSVSKPTPPTTRQPPSKEKMHPPVTDDDLNKGGLPKQKGDCFGCKYRPVPNSPQDPPPGQIKVPPTGGIGPQPPGDDSQGNQSPPPTQPPTDTGQEIGPGDSGGF